MSGANEGSTFGDDLEREIGLLLREKRRQESDDREPELNNIFRSGSAPPTVEGSLSAVGGLLGGSGGGGRGVTSNSFLEFSGAKTGNGFASEEELRSDPAYHSYYYSNVNLNPRLPPPLLSKEDWKFAQRLNGAASGLGGIGDSRKVKRPENGTTGGRSLFSMPPGFDSRKPAKETASDKVRGSAEWSSDGLIGLSGLRLENKQKSLAKIFQDDLGQATAVIGPPSRPASHTCFDESSDSPSSPESELAKLRQELALADASRSNGHSSSAVQKIGAPSSYTYAAALGASLSRGNTPDPQIVARAPSPCLTPIGGERVAASERRSSTTPHSLNRITSSINESANLAAHLSGINLSANGVENGKKDIRASHLENEFKDSLFDLKGGQNNNKQHMYGRESPSAQIHMPYALRTSDAGMGIKSGPAIFSDRQLEQQKYASAPRSPYSQGCPVTAVNGGGGLPSQYQLLDNSSSSLANYGGLGGFSLDTMIPGQLAAGNLPPLYENVTAASAMGFPGTESKVLGRGLASGPNTNATSEAAANINRMASQLSGSALHSPLRDPMYLQYLRTTEYASQLAALNDPSANRNYLGNSYLDMLEIQKAYLGSVLSPQKSMYNLSVDGKSSGVNHHGYYGNIGYGDGMSYPGSPLANPILPNSPVGPGSPLRGNEILRLSPGMRNGFGGFMGHWQLDGKESFELSLLEEFKSNKTKCYELLEIAGHVVEFSADQYGSRFIQQKLETATIEEKNTVYQEIMPQALELMTDVFGNYVIQKFFEHGLASQRRELAGKLFGRVLALSLQMYGCRVIQKAIEVVDLDQKIKMVKELDGHIMNCVRDQNGNHVIQKCIECVPEDAIYFIVSTFFDQVVTLSTHPYGCRVIQRVLEHCKDPETQSKVMNKILGTVSMLAQDQYGNYVVQHVLEHGQPQERCAIIEELTCKIVEMSQQKFASNVVEKCLAFGSAAQRQLMVNEMLGSNDENEPLQAMMKDQFGNYVVQKVLETCEDHQREIILARIKIHLNALKKYTYGKHIVARVEKLVAAGERRMAAAQMLNSAA